MADISNSKMILAKNSFFGKNYQKRKLPKKEIICQEKWKNAKKILKNIEKIPTGLESAENAQNPTNTQINYFTGWKSPEKFRKNC